MSNLGQFTRLLEEKTGYSPASVRIKKGVGVSTYHSGTQTIDVYCGGLCVQEQAFVLAHEFAHFVQHMNEVLLPTAIELEAAKKTVTCQAEYARLPWEADANWFALDMGKGLGFIDDSWYPTWWFDAFGEVN